jgi:hypothetical protein
MAEQKFGISSRTTLVLHGTPPSPEIPSVSRIRQVDASIDKAERLDPDGYQVDADDYHHHCTEVENNGLID